MKIARPISPSMIPYGTHTALMNSIEYAIIPGVSFLSAGSLRGGVGRLDDEERDTLDDRLVELFRDFSPPLETQEMPVPGIECVVLIFRPGDFVTRKPLKPQLAPMPRFEKLKRRPPGSLTLLRNLSPISVHPHDAEIKGLDRGTATSFIYFGFCDLGVSTDADLPRPGDFPVRVSLCLAESFGGRKTG